MNVKDLRDAMLPTNMSTISRRTRKAVTIDELIILNESEEYRKHFQKNAPFYGLLKSLCSLTDDDDETDLEFQSVCGLAILIGNSDNLDKAEVLFDILEPQKSSHGIRLVKRFFKAKNSIAFD